MIKSPKQIIEYWFETNVFNAPVLVKINMIGRDEEQAMALFEKMFAPLVCRIIERPVGGKYLAMDEVWEL